MKKIMILGASILQLPAIKKSVELGLETIVVDMNPNAIGFDVDGITKEVISTTDIVGIVESAKKHHIDGIMTLATDMPMRAVAAVARELDIIGIDEDTALKATDKGKMRTALLKADVPIPVFYVVRDEKEYVQAVKRFNKPFIVKPADSSGSRGIVKVENLTDSDSIIEAYKYCRPYSKNGDVIVEEYMEGPEVSVETISVNGECNIIQITDKLTTGAPYYVEMGHSQPTGLCEETKALICKVTRDANKAIGIMNGPSHTEIIVTDEGPKVVELGARLGGDNITTHLVPLSTGINMVEACIKIALGEKPDLKKKCNVGSAIRYFTQKQGVLTKVEGIEEAQKCKGVKQVSFVYEIGDNITEVNSSGSRIGFVIATDVTAGAAVKDCCYAMNKVHITIENGDNNG